MYIPFHSNRAWACTFHAGSEPNVRPPQPFGSSGLIEPVVRPGEARPVPGSLLTHLLLRGASAEAQRRF